MSVLLVLLYASPPLNLRLSPGERGRSKKKSLANLWPLSVFRRLPFSGSHRMILLSDPPLARTLPSKRQATDQTLKIWDVELGTCKATLEGHRYLCLFPPLTGGEA